MKKCKICKRGNAMSFEDTSIGKVCWSCAELHSVLVSGKDMDNWTILPNQDMPDAIANNLIRWMVKNGWFNNSKSHCIESENLSPSFARLLYNLASWIQLKMEHIKDAIVKAAQEDGGIVAIKNVDNPN